MLRLGSDRLKISRQRQKLPDHSWLFFIVFFVYQDFMDIISVVMLMVCFLSPLFTLCVPYQAKINLLDVCIDLEAIWNEQGKII